MVEVHSVIRNAMGIHCRPSAVIVKESRTFTGELKVTSPNGTCDPRSIMALISLCLGPGTPVTIQVTGDGEKKVAAKLSKLFARRFDFPPNPASDSPLSSPTQLGSA